MKIILKFVTYVGLVACGFLMGMAYTNASSREKDDRNRPSLPTKQEAVPTTQQPKAQIKGNQNARGELIYHVPGGQYYNRVKGQKFFHTEEDAQQAGYRRSLR